MVQRYIVTGAPGAGKTSVLRELSTRGFAVVGEAATDVITRERQRGISEPWRDAGFLTLITQVQQKRLDAGSMPPAPQVQLHDRSVLCTLALARFLGYPVPAVLAAETGRVLREQVFEPAVFLLRPLGFIEATAARRISYADSLVFEKVHEAVYAEHGFELIGIPAAPVAERATVIAGHIAARR